MSGTFEIKNERVTFRIGYNPGFISDVKEITGRRYDGETKTWSCPVNFVTSTPIKNLISKYALQKLSEPEGAANIGQEDLNDIDTVVEHKFTDVALKLEQYKLPWIVLPYQIRGITYMLLSKRCINGSDMGTGKTMMSILSVELANAFPCVVVVPASVKYNWGLQWKLLNPMRSLSVIENEDSDFTADVLVMTYNGVGRKEIIKSEKVGVEDKVVIHFKYKQLESLKPLSIILDEAQAIKSSKSLRAKSIKKLVKGVNYRFLLTGTSILNRPSEIINLLVSIDQFDVVFGSWKDFIYRYCAAYESRFGLDYSGASNLLELNQKLRKACYYRVEKRDVIKELPERIETLLQVDIGNRKEYDAAESDLIKYLSENYGTVQAFSAMQAESLVLINTLTRLAAEGKEDEIIDWLDNFLESSSEKLIVFGVHVNILKSLASKYKCDHITGDISPKDRQKIVSDFQTNNKRILFLNILTGSLGIDGLQHVCSTMLFIEYPWRYSDIDQAISRLERMGQKSNLSIYFMLGRNTIDEKMWEMLMHKRTITDGVNKGQDFDTVSYMKMLVQYYL